MISRPYSNFSLAFSLETTPPRRLSLKRRVHVWLFLCWRQVVASILAGLLAVLLNALPGLRGFPVTRWIGVVAVPLIIGPILIKMLIGHQFSDFRIEVK